MVEKISDLISMNSQAALIPGVQLEWYGNSLKEAENERLVSSYIFSSGAATQNAASAITIFDRIRQSLTQPDTHNVFTVIAHYGHGKSHFALVLANYFGRRLGDPALEKLLDQLEACTDKNTAFHFRQFKKNAEKPQLVVRLSGDSIGNLRQAFLSALRRALDEHEETRNYALKAVSVRAAEWLRSLTPEQRERATEWLSKEHHTDFVAFVETLEKFDLTKVEVARKLSRVLLNVEANFGADVDLREIINQVMTDLCTKPDAPFHRMVILFDEMGRYAEKWCHNRMAAGDSAPQQLTNACDNWKGKLSLIAFLQRPMDSFVRDFGAAGDFRQWAERFPDETSFKLDSSLEKVIGGLLAKRPDWDKFARDFMPKIEEASKAAWRMLPTYQQRQQQWTEQSFNSIVGVGAFPLHPLTTGLLCNLTFAQGSRTIIGFVDSAFQVVKDEGAASSGKPNWVWPTRLVDEFAANLADETSFGHYEHAVKTGLGANSPEHLYQVLKALFLYEIGGVKKYSGQRHATVLAALCGLPESQVQAALDQLDKEYSIIRYAQASGEYKFCDVGMSRADIRQQLQRAVADKVVGSLADKISKLDLLAQFSFPESKATGFKNEYGLEGDEWQLAPVMVDAAKLSLEGIRQVIKDQANPAEARGLLVYTVSGDDAELDLARNRATSVLNDLRNGPQPFPVVIAVPQTPAAKLGHELLMRDELSGWGIAKIEQYGQSYHEAVKDSDRRIEEELSEHLNSGGIRYYVPSAVEQRLNSHQSLQLDPIASQLFEEAFPHRVPAKFHVMKLSSTGGNSAVAAVARQLLTNDVALSTLKTVEQNLVKAVLHEGPDKWGVLTLRNTVKEPSHDGVRKAWDYLDQAIPEDRRVSFGQLSAALRAMPYGFDDFTLTLLYASWIGKHKNELRFFGTVSAGNNLAQPLALSDLQNQMDKAKTFIKWLDERNVHVQHAGRGSRREAGRLPDKLRAVTEYEDAVAQIATAVQVAASLSPDDELTTPIQEQINKLKEEMAKVDKHLKDIQKFCHAAETSERKGRIDDLLTLEKGFPPKPDTPLQYDQGFITDAKKLFEGLIEKLVSRKTTQRLERIEGRDALMRDLESLRNALHKSGREKLERDCLEAIERIGKEYDALKAGQEEAAIVGQVESMRFGDAGLASCREMAVHVQQVLDEKLSSASDKARQKVLRVQQQISRRIVESEEWIALLPGRISSAAGVAQLQHLRDEIIKRIAVFADTPEAESLLACQEQVEAKIAELAEAEQQQAVRQERINTYFSIVKERADRVIQARAFHDAVRELANLQTLPPLPDGISLTDAEDRQAQDHFDKSRKTVAALFDELKTGKQLHKASDFEQREKQFELALAELDSAPDLPSEWRGILNDLLEAVRREYEDWQEAKRKEEDARRLAQEQERRQAQNRKLVKSALQQANSAQSLREIQNAMSSLSAARAGLEPPCEEHVGQVEDALAALSERDETVRGWINRVLPESLSLAWAVGEIQALRQKIVTYESLCAGDEILSSALSQARLMLDERHTLLDDLAAIERDATSIDRCQEKLIQVERLKLRYSHSDEKIVETSLRLCEKLNRLRIEQRREAESWLAQFRAALERDIPSKEAGELIRKLNNRLAGLEEQDEPFLASVRERLTLILDCDVVARIIEDFKRLQTSEQKAECLMQMIELCKADGMPDVVMNRLMQFLEMRAVV